MRESNSFIHNIWKKLKRDSQYQLEKVYNQASHLEYFQSILIEFDSASALTESTMVRYFEKDLKLSIKAEMDQDATHLDKYEEIVAKAVKAEAKVDLRPGSHMRKTDLQVLWRSWPTHNTAYKVQTQVAVNCGDDSKASKAPTSNQESEPSNKARKNKK